MHSQTTRPSVTIELRSITIQAIRDNQEDKDDLLQEDIENDKDSIINLLRNYADEKDHRGQVDDYDSIEYLEVDKSGVGGFTIYYRVNIYSGCKDLDEDLDEEMHVEINIDFKNKTANLIGEELMPQREPDEY